MIQIGKASTGILQSYWTEKKKKKKTVNEKAFKQLTWGKKSWKGESKRWKAASTV